MKFNSKIELYQFIWGLSSIGYSASLINIEKLFKDNECNKHIHLYDIRFEIDNTRNINLVVFKPNEKISAFSIQLVKKG